MVREAWAAMANAEYKKAHRERRMPWGKPTDSRPCSRCKIAVVFGNRGVCREDADGQRCEKASTVRDGANDNTAGEPEPVVREASVERADLAHARAHHRAIGAATGLWFAEGQLVRADGDSVVLVVMSVETDAAGRILSVYGRPRNRSCGKGRVNE